MHLPFQVIDIDVKGDTQFTHLKQIKYINIIFKVIKRSNIA